MGGAQASYEYHYYYFFPNTQGYKKHTTNIHWYTPHTTKAFTGFFGGSCIALVTARLWVVVLKSTRTNFFTKHILKNLLVVFCHIHGLQCSHAPMHSSSRVVLSTDFSKH